MTHTEVQLSVVIPTHKRQDSLVRLLKSITKQHFNHSQLEVIVVSNIPDQATELSLSQLQLPFLLDFLTVGKLGVNRARNLGLKRARAPFVFFLDDDCELINSDHLERIRSIHLGLPHVSAVGGLYQLPEKANQYEIAYTGISNQWVKESLDNDLMQTERLLGGNVCYKKAHLEKHRLKFNNSIIFGGAETELHNRMVQNHLDLRLSDLEVRHHVKLDKRTFLSKAYKQGYGSSIDPIERDNVHALRFISQKRVSYLEYLYRHLFRAGQKRALMGLKVSDSDLGTWPLLIYSLESRVGKLISDIYIGCAFAFWIAFHNFLTAVGNTKKVLVVTAHRIYWPIRRAAVNLYLFCKWSILDRTYWTTYAFVTRAYWRIYALITGVYWWFYKWFHYTKGALIRHLVVGYWRGHKKWRNFLKTTRAGIDPSLSHQKFNVSDKPSAYLPVSRSCSLSCRYCHLLKAKEAQILSAEARQKEAAALSSLGYFRITLPCNVVSMPLDDLDHRLSEHTGFEKEIILNPDMRPHLGWSQTLDCFSNRGCEFLLLYRACSEFESLYSLLKARGFIFRILCLQDVSPDLSSLYKMITSDDHSLVEWLSTSSVEPVRTDPKNKKKATHIANTLKKLNKLNVKQLPKTSNIHYPFLVPSDNLQSQRPEGFVAWQSDSIGTTKSSTIRYSIIVPVRFQLSHSCKILRNFSDFHYDKDKFEIVFIDDGNQEPLATQIHKTFTEFCDPNMQVQVIRWNREHEGKYDNSYRAGQARNLGIQHSKGQALLFIDSDILTSPNLLKELDKRLQDNMLIQFPRHMLTKDASKTYTPYSKIDMSKHTYKQDFYWENFKSTKDWESLENHWKYTCTYGLAVTRKTFEMIGPFRTEYIFYGFEDVDFGYRLFQKGCKFQLIQSPVFHLYPDKDNSFHFDQDKRFNALSKSASIFLHRNMDLGFYMDLNHFLDRSIKSKFMQPYYYLDYKWGSFRDAMKGKKTEVSHVD